MNFETLTIEDVKSLYEKKIISFLELIEMQVNHIRNVEKDILSLVNFDEELYLQKAKNYDTQSKVRGTLENIPFGVKDLIDIKGMKTEANSKSLKGNISEKDSTVVTRLKNAGAFVSMKTNTHEYAYGAVSPPTRNPWDFSKIPGGSSGGSAAATSSGIVLGSLGSDPAGSIREPAALCSVVGFKPTYNWIPLSGVVPLAWTLDVVGPITKTISDCAIVFGALSENYQNIDIKKVENKHKIGILEEYFAPMEQQVSDSYNESITMLERIVTFNKVYSWNIDEVISTIFVILTAESAAFLDKKITHNPDNFGGDVKQFVEMGKGFSSTDYINSQRARRVITNKVDTLFNDYDFLLAPAQLISAPSPNPDTVVIEGHELPRDINLIKPLVLSSLCGYPSISIPFRKMKNGQFFSIQIIAKRNDDSKLLDFAKLLEKEFDLKYVNPLA